MLTDLLIKIFIRNPENTADIKGRLAYGMLAGIGGIAINVLLFVIKFTIGLLSGSVAIAADAANNLSDAGSSVVTVIGFKLAAQPADKDHPFGHGRVEYVAGVVVSVIVIVVGFNFFRDSIMRFFTPKQLTISNVAMVIFGSSVIFKLWLFFFYKKIAAKINSDVIKAAAFDSLSDTISTAAVLAATIVGKYTSFPVDAVTGTIVAALVLYGGIKLLKETTNPLLGERPCPEMVEALRNTLLQCEGIRGVHDIIIHNYGHNQYFATAHAEVSPEGTLMSAHDMLENAEIYVSKRMPIRLLLHCDPCHLDDLEVIKWRGQMEEIVTAFDCQFKLYDFRLKTAENGKLQLHFHLLTPRHYLADKNNIHAYFTEQIKKSAPEVELIIEFIESYV